MRLLIIRYYSIHNEAVQDMFTYSITIFAVHNCHMVRVLYYRHSIPLQHVGTRGSRPIRFSKGYYNILAHCMHLTVCSGYKMLLY